MRQQKSFLSCFLFRIMICKGILVEFLLRLKVAELWEDRTTRIGISPCKKKIRKLKEKIFFIL